LKDILEIFRFNPIFTGFSPSQHVLRHPSLIFFRTLILTTTLIITPFLSTSFRIREVADRINKHGTQTISALHSLKVPVKQVVVGNSYLGVLLTDGRAFRVAYSVIAERLDLTKQDSTNKK
jgi:hypothetical protein